MVRQEIPLKIRSAKTRKRKYVINNIKLIYHLHIMQLRCIRCALFYHDKYEIINLLKHAVLQINIEQYSHTNLQYDTNYLEKYMYVVITLLLAILFCLVNMWE